MISSLSVCSLEFADDPELKTSASSYEFKYIPTDQFERILKTVQHDRSKLTTESQWKDYSNGNQKCHPNFRQDYHFPRICNSAQAVLKPKSSIATVITHSLTPSLTARCTVSEEQVIDCNIPDAKLNKTYEASNTSLNEPKIEEDGKLGQHEMVQSYKKYKKTISSRSLPSVILANYQFNSCDKAISARTCQSQNKIVQTDDYEYNINTNLVDKASKLTVRESSKSSLHSDTVSHEQEICLKRDKINQNESRLSISEQKELQTLREMQAEYIIKPNSSVQFSESERCSSLGENSERNDNNQLKTPASPHLLYPRTIIESEVFEPELDLGYDIPEKKHSVAHSPKLSSKYFAQTSPKLRESSISSKKSEGKHIKKQFLNNKSSEIIASVEIKEIKQEELAILSKITYYQSKIIRIIDLIILNLLDVPEPDSNIDKKRRERRANEFSSRFSRNYLYQLDRQIEDLSIIPKEQYLSRLNNEFRIKVCTLFGTMYQAIQSYHKNMCYFIVDQSPRKLTTVINLISNATKLCLQKAIFDKDDAMVTNLLEKCQSTISYIENMRVELENINVISADQKRGKQRPPKAAKKLGTQGNLSMYGISAAPCGSKWKIPPTKNLRHSKAIIAKDNKSGSKTFPKIGRIGQSQKQNKKKLGGSKESTELEDSSVDYVKTQIENVPNTDSQLMFSPLSQKNSKSCENAMQDPQHEKTVNHSIMEALQHSAPEDIQKLFEPLMHNLEHVIKSNKETPMDLNDILSKLTSTESNIAEPEWKTLKEKYDSGSIKQCITKCDDNIVEYSTPVTHKANSNSQEKYLVSNAATNDKHRLADSKQLARALLNRDEGSLNLLPAATSGECGGDVIASSSFIMEESPTFTKESQSGTGGKSTGNEGKGAREPSVMETNNMHKIRYNHNVQYTFVTSNENEHNINESSTRHKTDNQEKNVEISADNSQYEETNQPDHVRMERAEFFQQIVQNPLYVNDVYSEPWKTITRIADNIIENAIESVQKNMYFGEDDYVRDFIQAEFNY